MKYPDPILMNMSNAEYHAKEDISASDLKSWVKTCPKVWHQLKYGDDKVDHAPVVKRHFEMGNWLTLSHLSQKGQQKTMLSAQTKQQKLARLQQKKLSLKAKNQFHRQNMTCPLLLQLRFMPIQLPQNFYLLGSQNLVTLFKTKNQGLQ